MRSCIVLLFVATACIVSGCKSLDVPTGLEPTVQNTIGTPPLPTITDLEIPSNTGNSGQADEPAQTATTTRPPFPPTTTPSADGFSWLAECGDLVNEAYLGIFGDEYRLSFYGGPSYDDVIGTFGEPAQNVEFEHFVRMYFTQGIEFDYIFVSFT